MSMAAMDDNVSPFLSEGLGSRVLTHKFQGKGKKKRKKKKPYSPSLRVKTMSPSLVNVPRAP